MREVDDRVRQQRLREGGRAPVRRDGPRDEGARRFSKRRDSF